MAYFCLAHGQKKSEWNNLSTPLKILIINTEEVKKGIKRELSKLIIQLSYYSFFDTILCYVIFIERFSLIDFL